MAFELPDLPYAYDALQPYMSKETLEFHHDKHHNAYVETGNKLLAGSDWSQAPDSALSDAQRAAWRAYRQALRDLPGQADFPASIAWPEPPVGSQS